MKVLTKSFFKKQLGAEPSDTLALRFEQLVNEYPLYSVAIIAAFAEVASARV